MSTIDDMFEPWVDLVKKCARGHDRTGTRELLHIIARHLPNKARLVAAEIYGDDTDWIWEALDGASSGSTQGVGGKLARVLVSWARHECGGRLRNEIDMSVLALIESPTPRGEAAAVSVLLQLRGPLIGPMLAAGVIDVVEVKVRSSNSSRLGYLEHARLSDCPHNDWSLEIAARRGSVDEPIIAVATEMEGTLHLIDGIHRARGWLDRAETSPPLVVTTIVTSRSMWA